MSGMVRGNENRPQTWCGEKFFCGSAPSANSQGSPKGVARLEIYVVAGSDACAESLLKKVANRGIRELTAADQANI